MRLLSGLLIRKRDSWELVSDRVTGGRQQSVTGSTGLPFDNKIFLLLFSDLSRSVYDIFNRCQRQQSHWASGVEFLGADSDFGAVAEFEAVGEAGGGVDVDYSCIDFVQEFLGMGVVVGDDCFGVFCVVVVDVCNRFVDGRDGFDGHDVVEILFSPVLFCRFFCFRHVFSCLFVCAHFHMFFF